MAQVTINSRGARRLRQGHVWVFDSDVRDAGGAVDGDVVQVVTSKKSGNTSFLGLAFFNAASMIRLRLIDRRAKLADEALWREKLESALDLRKQLGLPNDDDTAYRLVFSEADGIPGLIVDRYGDVIVLQTLSAGADRLMPTWLELFDELIKPRVVVERNDTRSRGLEGLDKRSGVLVGELDGPIEIREGGIRLLIDPLAGQKTGYFLDQRENRRRAGEIARGRCLDMFCYQGGFGLQMARGGAEQVVLVDQSERSLESAKAAARINGLSVETVEANAFDFLREQQAEGATFDVVVLDPPAFAKNKGAVARAARGYKEINLRAMRLLNPGGVLITSSCSYHMRAEQLEEVLHAAAVDSGRTLQVLERRSQARDHPERLGFPESHYLKCFVLRVV